MKWPMILSFEHRSKPKRWWFLARDRSRRLPAAVPEVTEAPRDPPALEPLDLHVPAGQHVALVEDFVAVTLLRQEHLAVVREVEFACVACHQSEEVRGGAFLSHFGCASGPPAVRLHTKIAPKCALSWTGLIWPLYIYWTLQAKATSADHPRTQNDPGPHRNDKGQKLCRLHRESAPETTFNAML